MGLDKSNKKENKSIEKSDIYNFEDEDIDQG